MDNDNLIGFFNSINSEEVLKSFIKNNTKENLNLEFKQKQDSRNGDLGEKDKFNFSRALSGFANSGGGVLIWGIETRNKDESAKRLKPKNKWYFCCIMYNNFGGERKMEKYLIYFLAGFCGGIIRGLVGFVKNKTLEKANHFKPQYFLITILISGIVGTTAGILADTE